MWIWIAIVLSIFSGLFFSDHNQASISGFVVPHHDIVKVQRAQFFEEVKDRIPQPKTIILVSPNHYDSGRAAMQTTDQNWQVKEGTIEANKKVIQVVQLAGVNLEPASFPDEHGIRLILGDIKRSFPQAQLVPLILKEKTSLEDIKKVESNLFKNCVDCLMISSVDFSHYQPALLADLHDQLSTRGLQTLDTNLLFKKAEVDSPAALALLALWAKDHHTENFVLKQHTNSDVLLKTLDAESTTHVMGWYETGQKVQPAATASFTIGGDMMFDRLIAYHFLDKGLETVFDQLGNRTFWGVDAAIANLEGPVSDKPVPLNIQSDHLNFSFPPQTIQALQYLKLTAVSQANNHSGNQGRAGVNLSKYLLEKVGIKVLGGPTAEDIPQIVSIVGQNITIDMIGVHALVDVPDIAPLIQHLKSDPTHRVLIFPHWGIEYASRHGSLQQELAHHWIDAGADIVIGAHPHVIQDAEVYKGKPIIYSVGNFLFDQTFSKATQQGLLVSGEFTESGLKLFAEVSQSIQLKPQLMRGQTKKEVLDKLYEPFQSYKQSTPAGDMFFFPR